MTLLDHYRDRHSAALECARTGGRVVGLVGTGIPAELVEAAGCFPLVISGELLNATPHADEFMEGDLGRETLSVFERMLDGTYEFLDLLIVSRTSDSWLQLYYYLKEVVRLGEGGRVPPLYLYDMLHLRSDVTYQYGLARTLELRRRLEVITGSAISEASLGRAIASANARRALQRDLDVLRRQALVTGTEAFQALGASGYLPAAQYRQLLEAYLGEIRRAQSRLAGPRVLLVPAFPLFSDDLHRAIEACGAVVVSEDDCYGARSVGADVDPTIDPLRAIFEKCYLDVPSPRIFPAADRHAWFLAELGRGGFDGVIFYIPPGDLAFGWDYPRLEEFVRGHGLRSLLLFGDDALLPENSASISSAVRSFVDELVQPSRVEAIS